MEKIKRKINKMNLSIEDIKEGTNGICLSCGEVFYGGIEPDARKYPCECCEKKAVFGMEEALLMGYITIE